MNLLQSSRLGVHAKASDYPHQRYGQGRHCLESCAFQAGLTFNTVAVPFPSSLTETGCQPGVSPSVVAKSLSGRDRQKST